ncbi:MAG TPA: hypothetical protein PKO06_18810 [Candidatus Ozemobacteraceae bacterium]|nr:hypothetical protein [Candidatus Ozemobacteraceae bacterium]
MNTATVLILIVLVIQVYKLARPMLKGTETGSKIVNTVDTAWAFVYDFSPAIYTIVEALEKKGVIKKEAKASEFLKLLQEEAKKQGVTLAPANEAAAVLQAKTMAAQDHIAPVPFVQAPPVQ